VSAALDRIAEYSLLFYLGLVGCVLLARGVRALNERRGGMISLSYGNGRTVRVPKGLSVLEASLRNNVPHASVCGGRARCSTCRIRVIGDCAQLPNPSQREAFVLNRVGTDDPSIRLACQLRPTEVPDDGSVDEEVEGLGGQRAQRGEREPDLTLFSD